ncbi:hypothetical protein HDU89_004201 [Geranomyces variabilis]|nr:hypothetical protein HDU89_004201 [Geranomyces variabilis]
MSSTATPPPKALPQASHIKIRLATAADAAALCNLARATFRDTFNPVPNTPTATNQQHDVDAYCESAFSPEVQAEEIAAGVVFVAEATDSGALVGYSRLTHDATEPCLTGPLPRGELKRLYVAAQYGGCGIGSKLFNAVVNRAKEVGDKTLWLGVWEHNYPAKTFYARKGLQACGEHVFLFGSDPQTDEIWEMEL